MSEPRKNKLHRFDQNWIKTNVDCLKAAFQQLIKTPIGAFMTIAVIGIALALPAGLSLALGGLQNLSGVTDPSRQIHVYFTLSVTDADRDQLTQQLQNRAGLSTIETITPEQALDAYKHSGETSGFLDLLDENPLPYSLIITPDDQLTPDQIASIVDEIRRNDNVSLVQHDAVWAQQLHKLLYLLKQITLVLSVLLILSVILIISNTIRVTVQSRLPEIQLSRQFGASRRFIRRPFLYQGLLYGLIGALFASLLLLISSSLLSDPVLSLLHEFQINTDTLSLPYFKHILSMLIFGVVVGIATAWMMVSWVLRDLESRDFF